MLDFQVDRPKYDFTPSFTPINIESQIQGQGRLGLSDVIDRAREAQTSGMQSVCKLFNRMPRHVAICGAGPSIANDIDTIKRLKSEGAAIWSVNKSHDYLLLHGITSDVCCLLDPMPWVAKYVKRKRHGTKYLLASQCHPDTLKAFKGYDRYLWHAGQDFPGGPEPHTMLVREFPDSDWVCVPGGTSVGLRSIQLGYALGGKKFHLFGMDSSKSADKMWAMPKDKRPDATDGAVVLRSPHTNVIETFETDNHMAKQAEDFKTWMGYWGEEIRAGRMPGFTIKVYGAGLLPSMAATMGLHADDNMNMKWSGI